MSLLFRVSLCAVLLASLLTAQAQSSQQIVNKNKGDFGLICQGKYPTIILYSPKNNEMYVGQRSSTPFFRTEEIIKSSVKITNDFITFTAFSNIENKYSINRSTLHVRVSYYSTILKMDDFFTLNCETMSDEDFIDTMKYDMAEHPKVISEPSPKKPNKI